MIVAGFPGIGKTYLTKTHPEVFLDSDSSAFSKLADGSRNPNFIEDYLKHILHIAQTRQVFHLVSTHAEVLQALHASGAQFVVVVPEISLLDEYVLRYKNRGSSDNFIQIIHDNWTSWLNDIDERGYNVIKLKSGQNLADVIEFDDAFNPVRLKMPLLQNKF